MTGFQKNEAGELYLSRILSQGGVWFVRTDFYADDRHDDISHCHLRTEWRAMCCICFDWVDIGDLLQDDRNDLTNVCQNCEEKV